jgi:predicted permease
MMRFYRVLLYLYPGSFRAEYDEELSVVFAERSRDRSALLVFLGALADVIPNAIAAHWDVLKYDLRYTVRSLRRTPGFAITAILVAALGVGANTAAFSLADFVLLRPLPFPEADRLLHLREAPMGGGTNELSPANFRDWKTQARSFENMGAYTYGASNMVGNGEPRRVELIRATPDLLPVLGVQPLLGRPFTASDLRQAEPLILSYPLWQSQFGGDRNVLGRSIRLDGKPHVITGVMPPTFQFPNRDIEAIGALVFDEEAYEDRTNSYITGVGRVRKGLTVDAARRELELIAKRLEQQHPIENHGSGVSALRFRDEVSERSRVLVLALCGAALCVLLLACANLASLFLARGAHRARELAVRAALGAGRERLVRQLLTESFAIAIAGGIAGVGLAALVVPAFAKLVPTSLPISEYPSIDLRVMMLAAAFVVLTGLAFGILPALRGSGATAADALRAGSRSGGGRTQRIRASLVVLEIVASVVLLVSSGLLIRAVWNLQQTDPGFRTDNVLTVRTALPWPKYETVARRTQFYTGVLEDVRALPGVESAAYVTGLPMQMRGMIQGVLLPGQEDPRDGSNLSALRYISPQYFSTMRIPLLRGRDVTDSDGYKQEYVAVISDSLAKKYWPNGDALGKRFTIHRKERTVVGIVGDIRTRGLERPSEPQVYLPYRQVEDRGFIGYVPKELVVRTSVTPSSLVDPIRTIVRRIDPEQPVSNVSTLAAIVDGETAPRMTQLRLLSALAGIALLIAGIGIHGLLMYTVSRRSQELGVRRALGAPDGGIVALVLREGVVLAAAGIVIGVFLAYAAARGMSALLFGIRPGDPMTFAIACTICFLTVLGGCLRPAARAVRIDPMTALRAE